MSSMKNHAYLLMYYPNEYELMMKLAKNTEIMRECELGKPFSVWSSKPKYNTEYRDKRIRSKYLPELIREIEGGECY